MYFCRAKNITDLSKNIETKCFTLCSSYSCANPPKFTQQYYDSNLGIR